MMPLTRVIWRVTSYRNSKNFGSSWISAAYATAFLREARFLNNARMICGTSCAVSGSGYLISSKIVEGMRGWQFHSLTEDIQFSTFCAVHGVRIAYAPAEFFDEQPVTFAASWKQRMRWTKGSPGVLHLWRTIGKDAFHQAPFCRIRYAWATVAPGNLITLISILANGAFLVVGLLSHGFLATDAELESCFESIIMTLFTLYQTYFVLGLLTTVFEYKHIHCPQRWRIVVNLFTFPFSCSPTSRSSWPRSSSRSTGYPPLIASRSPWTMWWARRAKPLMTWLGPRAKAFAGAWCFARLANPEPSRA